MHICQNDITLEEKKRDVLKCQHCHQDYKSQVMTALDHSGNVGNCRVTVSEHLYVIFI